MKVLIVDDSLTMRGLIAGNLAQMDLGVEVLEAGSGGDALKCLRDHADIALVLLDWHMSGMSGLECLQQMQAAPQTREVPVVMVTSEREKTLMIRALKAGARGYLVKPFTPERFQEKIEGFLATRRDQDLAARGSRLMGRIEQTAVSDLLQQAALTRKSGSLELDDPAGRYHIYVSEGKIVAADGPGVKGEEAIYEALALKSGSFNFRSDATSAEENVSRPIEALLLEAARRQQA